MQCQFNSDDESNFFHCLGEKMKEEYEIKIGIEYFRIGLDYDNKKIVNG
jgi:hypothetical protein